MKNTQNIQLGTEVVRLNSDNIGLIGIVVELLDNKYKVSWNNGIKTSVKKEVVASTSIPYEIVQKRKSKMGYWIYKYQTI
jgi:preprotein translocase subunit YajC